MKCWGSYVGPTDGKLEEVRDYIVFTYQHSFLKICARLHLDDQGWTLAGAVNFLLCTKTPPALEYIQFNK